MRNIYTYNTQPQFPCCCHSDKPLVISHANRKPAPAHLKSEHLALLPEEGSEASSHSENSDLIIDLPQWSAHCVEPAIFVVDSCEAASDFSEDSLKNVPNSVLVLAQGEGGGGGGQPPLILLLGLTPHAPASALE